MACMPGEKRHQLENKQRGSNPGRGLTETLRSAYFPFAPKQGTFPYCPHPSRSLTTNIPSSLLISELRDRRGNPS